MRTLSVFENISLDGYFVDARGDMSWAHRQDDEWLEFTKENVSGGGGELMFGRTTYDMMIAFWPTPQARETMPEVAKVMNETKKIVVSRSLGAPTWQNTRRIEGDLGAEVGRLKREDGPGIVVLGSGRVVAQLAEAGLIDAYQLVVCPIALGAGRTLFEGVRRPLNLILKRTKSFRNGNVVLWYERA